MRRQMSAALVALIMSVALLACATPAQARTLVVRADPVDGTVLAQAPQQLRLWLNEAIIPATAKITLVDTDGHTLEVSNIQTVSYRPDQEGLGQNFDATYLFLCTFGQRSWPSLLSVSLPDLQDGSYALTWQVIGSETRKSASGQLIFGVRQSDQSFTSAFATESSSRNTRQANDLMVSLAVQPNVPGQNFITLNVANTRRPVPAPIAHVVVRLSPANAAGAPVTLMAVPLNSSRYQISSDQLSAGDWQIQVIVSRAGMPDTVTTFPWNVPAASLRHSELAADATQAALPAAIIAGIVCAFIVLRRRVQSIRPVFQRFVRTKR